MSTEATLTAPDVVGKQVVKLTKSSLAKDKEDGLTTPEMAKKYNLAPSQMSKALKIAGIATKAKRKPSFIIVED